MPAREERRGKGLCRQEYRGGRAPGERLFYRRGERCKYRKLAGCIDVVCNLRAMRKLLQPRLFPPFLRNLASRPPSVSLYSFSPSLRRVPSSPPSCALSPLLSRKPLFPLGCSCSAGRESTRISEREKESGVHRKNVRMTCRCIKILKM